MIFSFHFISVLITSLIEKRKWRRALDEFARIQQILNNVNSNQSFAYQTRENDLKFDPPVFRQRYGTVHDVLLNERWRKEIENVVEFGCAEFGLFLYLKNLMGIREINFVDIDGYLLRENIFRVHPLNGDYLEMRTEPLKVNVFCGSIADPDIRIMAADVVIGIEIIEHLYPDVLEEVPYTVFHCIQPKIAIFTTPNSDFNVLLPNLKGFRHYDHKFEWTRQQFESWAWNITERFPRYFASFHGIGRGPEGSESLGCCSQMAVFVRRDIVDNSYEMPIRKCYVEKSKDCPESPPMRSFGICTYFSCTKNNNDSNSKSKEKKDFPYYELIRSIDYPFQIDNRSAEEKIMDDIKYKINQYGHYNSRFFNPETDRTEIPLSHLAATHVGNFITQQEMETLLKKHGYKLEECSVYLGENEKEICLINELEMENDSSSSKNNESRPRTKVKLDKSKKFLKALEDSGLAKSTSINGTSQPSVKDTSVRIDGYLFSSLSEEARERRRLTVQILNEDLQIAPFSTESLLRAPRLINRPLPDPNTINELDCLNNRHQSMPVKLSKIFFKHIKKAQLRFSSAELKKKRSWSESETEVSRYIRSILNCILENILNTVDFKEPSKLISDHIDDPAIETPPRTKGSSVLNLDFFHVPLPSISTNQEESINENPTDNQRNIRTFEGIPDTCGDENDFLRRIRLEAFSYGTISNHNSETTNSDDVELIPLLHEFASIPEISVNPASDNIALIGLNVLNNNDTGATEGDIFPAWLLHLLRDDDALVEGPHYLSQGDGQGVHPTIIVDNDFETADTNSEVSANDEDVPETFDENPERESYRQQSIGIRSNALSLTTNPDEINEELDLHIDESDVFFDSTDEE